MPDGKIKVMVAVADVDSLVKKGSAIDEHARHNTTSVYTAAKIFPMLPEKLSTNLTSLNLNQDRLAIVMEMVIGADGSLQDWDVYRAMVRNHAKLAYNSVAAWLEGGAELPAIAALKGLAENLRLQDKAAQTMKVLRHAQGALSLETIEARPIFEGDSISDLQVEEKNLAVIKLLGSGEYIVELSEDAATGHFGLAVKDYTHSTAPNRRYPDLITQRLLKAAIDGGPMPYSKEELDNLATQCTEKEDATNKVERQVGKSAAALLLESRIGEEFEAMVTGASAKGNWVRLLNIPIEGMLRSGFEGIDVGDRIRVQLISVDVKRGFIDFKRIGPVKALI